MTTTDPPRTRTSPHDVRGKHFTVRLRGLDQDEVRYFLAGLADQLEGIQAQVATLTQENETRDNVGGGRVALSGDAGRHPSPPPFTGGGAARDRASYDRAGDATCWFRSGPKRAGLHRPERRNTRCVLRLDGRHRTGRCRQDGGQAGAHLQRHRTRTGAARPGGSVGRGGAAQRDVAPG